MIGEVAGQAGRRAGRPLGLGGQPDPGRRSRHDGRLERQRAVFVPLAWENRVFGLVGVFLPPGVPGPSEAELAFYTALADQAAVAVTNARLTADARQAATLAERTPPGAGAARLGQPGAVLDDDARAGRPAGDGQGGLDDSGPLGRSVAELAELTRGALAEMRALIFELRPGALAEEGLVAALSKQAAALTARGRSRSRWRAPTSADARTCG